MTIQDTYKFGSLYVDADMTLTCLAEDGYLNAGDRIHIVNALRESNVDFTLDEDWAYGSMYQDDDQETPLVLIGTFGGYPGESIDEANARAAKEWAADRDYIYSFSSWFGGCEMVSLYLNFDACTLDEANEAIELAEGFREYPVLDEDLWSELQWKCWEDMITEMIEDSEREHSTQFTHEQMEYIHQTAGEKYGYWDEGYFPADEWDEIISEALDTDGTEVQLHQEEKLF